MAEIFDNEDFNLAYNIIENTSANLFLTGAAGTGKTTFLRKLREISQKRIIVTAPTGIAAINAGGVTLHSLFQLEFGPFVPGKPRKENHRFSKQKLSLIRSIDVLVIDEVSMVRADLLDYVDFTLRRLRDGRKPFGGVQLLLIGDLQQLPPVAKEDEWDVLRNFYDHSYFFASKALNQTSYLTIELKKVYRQSDPYFLSLLNKIREGEYDREVLEALNKQCKPTFSPVDGKHWIRLTTHNHIADAINDRRLAALKGEEREYTAEINGIFPENVLPADNRLRLKVGEQVMFIRNDSSGQKKYYNGMLGRISRLGEKTVTVIPEDHNVEITVSPESWENHRYELDEQTLEVTDRIEGVFSQLPLKAAWAITIHKSQGLTFDRAMIDTAEAFASGQTYVALSRCRTLKGMILTSPITPSAIICDPLVRDFIRISSQRRPAPHILSQLFQSYRLSLLNDLFDFTLITQQFDTTHRVVEEAFHNLFPKLTARYSDSARNLLPHISETARRFRNQYTPLFTNTVEMPDTALQKRINDACAYFLKPLGDLSALILDTPRTHDNKVLLKRLRNILENFEELLMQKTNYWRS